MTGITRHATAAPGAVAISGFLVSGVQKSREFTCNKILCRDFICETSARNITIRIRKSNAFPQLHLRFLTVLRLIYGILINNRYSYVSRIHNLIMFFTIRVLKKINILFTVQYSNLRINMTVA